MTRDKTHILIAEDSLTQAIKLQYLLEENGYRVTIARDGQEGADKVKAESPNLVISDIVMPKMSGYELCTFIKSDPDLKHIPVILLTSLSDPGDVIEALTCNADNFVTKPYEEKTLLARIEQVLINILMRNQHRDDQSVEILFSGKKHHISAGRTQILDLLLSTYENAVDRNKELLKIQEKLTDSNDRLVAEINERQRIAEELKKAREEADNASKAKSTFLANMSHEIRTPMNAIIGMAQLCMKTELSPKQYYYLDSMTSAANNLLGIINDILDFSKIEAGKLEIESAPFSMDTVLDNITNVIQFRAQEKGLDLILEMAMDVPLHLIGDSLRLSQVLINLTVNAIKFTDSGQIHISVRLVEDIGGSICLYFGVQDSGIGISKENLKQLLESFTQADGSTSRKYGGTGLGLSISRQLISLMGGELQCESEPGKGSLFSFELTLPLADQLDASELELKREVASGITALVIEDNKFAREMLVEQLESFSMKVTAVETAEQGLEEIDDHPNKYRLVIMDWQLPGMNGDVACQTIKLNRRLKKPPVVLMVTGHDLKENGETIAENSWDAFLKKPFHASKLLDTIAQALGADLVADAKGLDKFFTIPEGIKGARILVAEDVETNQVVVREMLEQVGFRVFLANDGEEACKAVSQADFEAILMDINMPKMDGYEATRLIRKHGHTLPIIALTANVLKGDREKCAASGMDDFVAKPIQEQLFLETLCKWIRPGNYGSATTEIPFREPERKMEVLEALDDLPDLSPAIDAEVGIRQFSGNLKLYKKMLIRFAEKNRDASAKIEKFFLTDENMRGSECAHGIKGAAGNLGALDLQNSAEALEFHLKGFEEGNLPELLKDFEQQLATFVATVSEKLSGHREPDDERRNKTEPNSDTSQLIEKFKNLARRVERFDYIPSSEFETLKSLCPHTIPEQILSELEEALLIIDHEKSTSTISKILLLLHADASSGEIV